MFINLVVPRSFKESENVGDKVGVCVFVCVQNHRSSMEHSGY